MKNPVTNYVTTSECTLEALLKVLRRRFPCPACRGRGYKLS